MRTTLILDDDVATGLERLTERSGNSFEQTVSETLRRGLAALDTQRGASEPYRVETFNNAFRSGVDPLKLNQISDEL